MDTHSVLVAGNSRAHTPHCCIPLCPACGGVFAPQRDGYRCTRCLFTLCIGCEPDAKTDPTAGDDYGPTGQ